jgi:uncharacterized protein YndB with AHSA1/START domain
VIGGEVDMGIIYLTGNGHIKMVRIRGKNLCHGHIYCKLHIGSQKVTRTKRNKVMKNDSIVVERTFTAPVEKVWNALTDPEQMRQWYFPMMEDFRPEKGFETRFDLVAGDKHFLHIWKVTDVIPGQKISYEWRYDGYPGNSLLTFELLKSNEGTKLVLTHEKLETFRGDINPGLAKDDFLQGWKGFINTRLKDYLDKIPATQEI